VTTLVIDHCVMQFPVKRRNKGKSTETDYEEKN
jgi:hypothetical protein